MMKKLLTIITCLAGSLSAAERPNIVFLLVDDLGRMDLGCYGSTFHETPNIDQLAADGLRFENAYSSHPVCGPSRSAMVSGKFPARLGVTGIPGKIPAGNIIWPKVLQDAGYKTLFAGKWHMSGPDEVTKYGFDINIGGGSNGQPGQYFWPFHEGGRKSKGAYPGLEDCPEGSFLPDVLTDHCIEFIEANKDEPFLVYLSYYGVHTRLQAKEEYLQHFQSKVPEEFRDAHDYRVEQVDGGGEIVVSNSQSNAVFAGLLKSVDDSVGRLVDTLDRLEIRDNTLIIFTADQGGLSTRPNSKGTKGWPDHLPACSYPYRGGKGWIYDGGVRVPFIVNSPMFKGGKVIETATINTDIYPTVLDVAKLPAMPEQHVDGRSILPVLSGSGELADTQDFVWMFPIGHGSGHVSAVGMQRGEYKLIYRRGKQGVVIELYNTAEDIGERNNLAKQMPERVEAMLKTLKSHPGTGDFISAEPKSKGKKGKG
ncbi:sulfatase [Persicirhabdus sediminis]|uniref:Sulfatase n=1 Tax=Persicirhabdus sediminis TaxID=454144 RepID=A0A8J7MD40_9BACT|nr:sulfatase [Persicirhabdus sediminis]MBK1790325.1 sulfatase [Persicirhabdus sediminis]